MTFFCKYLIIFDNEILYFLPIPCHTQHSAKLLQWMLLATTKTNTVTRHSDILTALKTTVMPKSKLYYKLYIQSLQ